MTENMKKISEYFALLNEEEFAQLQSAIETINRVLPHIAAGEKI